MGAEDGTYVDAGGLRTYYEAHGAGDPLVLLHGGMSAADSWGAQVPDLAADHRVYVPERRGHGHTPDVPGPITYAAMADDTIAFLDALGLTGAHLVGWSDGAVVGLLVALKRPELVGKLVLIGQYFNLDGERPEAAAVLAGLESDPAAQAMFRASYDAVSPDGPEHFPVVLAKVGRMWRTEPTMTMEQLSAVSAPTLVMQGDDDIVDLAHSRAVYDAIPDAQLAVIPGTSHAAPIERPALVNAVLRAFLTDPQPARLIPVTRS